MKEKLALLAALLVAIASVSMITLKQTNEAENLEAPSQLDFVKGMDFKRFMGIWYDIASLPNAIQKGCKCPQSLDTLQSQLVIELAESCIILGKNITSKSKAVATVDGYGNWTNWNGPISAPYWVIHLDPNYQWVVIGQPSRKGFWIMSRKPHMDQSLLRTLIDWGTSKQFNLKDLQYPDQSCFAKNKLKVEQDGSVKIEIE